MTRLPKIYYIPLYVYNDSSTYLSEFKTNNNNNDHDNNNVFFNIELV